MDRVVYNAIGGEARRRRIVLTSSSPPSLMLETLPHIRRGGIVPASPIIIASGSGESSSQWRRDHRSPRQLLLKMIVLNPGIPFPLIPNVFPISPLIEFRGITRIGLQAVVLAYCQIARPRVSGSGTRRQLFGIRCDRATREKQGKERHHCKVNSASI